MYQLPFHLILYHCDARTMMNMLCVSIIYNNINISDIVKNVAKRKNIEMIKYIPTKYLLLFIQQFHDSENNFAMRWASENGNVEVMKYLEHY